MKILSIGGSGLIGSRIEELLSTQYSFFPLSLEQGINITEPETLNSIRTAEKDSVVFLLAAKTDVDGCEKDKAFGEKGDAWQINVIGAQNVVDACRQRGLKLVYVSTDFVFDGKKQQEGAYSENDTPNPINWYAKTKYEAEKIVQNSGLPFLILRFAFPYRSAFAAKKDFVQAILGRLKIGEKVQAISDQLITPTFVDDMAYAFSRLLETRQTGIYHVTGSSFLSPFAAAKKIANVFSYDENLVEEISLEKYFQGRAQRPSNLSLKNDKIAGLGVNMHTFVEGLELLRK